MVACSRKAAIITSIVCAVIILALGTTAIVLGTKGYFEFHSPCIDVLDFEVVGLDLEESEDNTVLGVLDLFTFGLASQFILTQAVVTMEMVLEVNNTNSFDLDYQQADEGIITIPLETPEGSNNVDEDLVVGSWEIPRSTLKARSRNNITIGIRATIDLLSSEAVGLADSFVSGDLVVFRIGGSIKGSSWVPGANGKTSLVCWARVDDVTELESGSHLRCTHSTNIAGIIDDEGRIEKTGEDMFGDSDDDEVEPECLV